jgi:hypothetical protein
MSDLFEPTLAEMVVEAELKPHHAERQIRLMAAICAELARRLSAMDEGA